MRLPRSLRSLAIDKEGKTLRVDRKDKTLSKVLGKKSSCKDRKKSGGKKRFPSHGAPRHNRKKNARNEWERGNGMLLLTNG